MRVYVFMHASENTDMHIYLFAQVHPCMDTCRCIENMMRMQTFIGYVRNDLIMHEFLQRMYCYIFLTMIADNMIAILCAKIDSYEIH